MAACFYSIIVLKIPEDISETSVLVSLVDFNLFIFSPNRMFGPIYFLDVFGCCHFFERGPSLS